MPDSIGTAFVDVAFDPKQIEGQMGGIGGKMTSGFGKLGGLAGAAMVTGIGAAVAGGVAVGKYLYGVGEQFDAMSDSIRVATGKTGTDLKSLTDTAKKVGTDVPASFEDAGKAVSSLSTRLGLTGQPLRDVSGQMLELARLSGTDLPTALNSVTRMLGDAGMKGADASKGIDMLWRASQASQVPVTRLSDLLTKFGGPMRQLGFSFAEQAGMLAKFEKEGVNTELVMGSMRIALGKMAKAGKDPVEGLRATMQAIKDAGSAGKANALAIELFGARAGPDMAAAIREGRFSIDDLVKTIETGKDTVKKASDDTKDFSENWLLFKNRVAVAVAPAASAMFDAIGKGMDQINKQMPGLIAGFEQGLGPAVANLGPQFAGMGDSFKSLGPALSGLKPMFADLAAIIRDLAPVWQFLAAAVGIEVKFIVDQIKLLLTIVEGVVKIIRGLLEGDWRMAWEGAQQIFGGFVDFVTARIEVAKMAFNALKDLVLAVAGPIGTAVTNLGKAILDGLTAGVAPLVALATRAFDGVRAAITGAIGAITTAARAVGTAIATGVSTVLNTLAALTARAFAAVTAAIRGALSAVTSAAGAIGRAVVDNIMRAVNTVSGLVTGALNRTAAAAVGAARAIGTAIVGGIRAGLAAVYATVKGGLDRIWSAISAVAGAAAGAAVAIGTAIISGIVSGLSGLIGAVGSKIASSVSGAISWARGHTGSTTEEYAKAQLGDPIPAGMIQGIVEGEKPLGDAIAKTVTAAVDAGRASVAAGREKFGSAWTEVTSSALEAFDKLKGQLKTRAETLLDQMALDRQVAEMKAKITSATDELAAARAAQAALAPQEGETAEAFAARAEAAKQRVLAAEKALADAVYEQRRVALERQAEQQRIQLDARIALQRKHLEDSLAAQGAAYATGQTNAVTAHNNLIKTLNSYGVKYQTAGKTLGSAFVRGMNQDITAGMNDLEALLERIRRAITSVTTANAAVGRAAAPAAAGVAAAGLLAAPAGPTTLGGAPSGGTLYGRRSPFANVTRAIRSAGQPALELPATLVRVYIGDQELRGIVRTEVGYVDDATARVVLAGAR